MASKLEQLIQELCPDGVEYKNLGEMCSLVTKQTGFDYSNHIKNRLLTEKKERAIPYMQTKFFSGHRFNYDTDYYVPEDVVKRFPKITLNERCLLFSIVGASIGNVGLFPAEKDCFLGGAICVAKIKPEWNVDYLYYCVESHDFQRQIIKKTKGPQATITVEDIRRFIVPVPPLEVQREIVRVLDNFTFLSAELSAELSARRKQYEYYRDQLLDLKHDIPKVKLKDIATDIYRGAGIKRDEVTESGIPCVRYGEIYTTYNTWFDKCVSHTRESVVSTPKFFEHGDILFAITGESVEDIAKSIAYVGHEKCMAGGDIVVLKHRENPKYLSYALATDNARRQKSKGKIKSKVVHSSVPAIEELEIPLPERNVQDRIVEVLDYFESICNDLGIGLPAEIEARQKQYEYYRDKLLSFNEKGV